MARIDSPVHPATTDRLDLELAALFGREILERAQATDPADLELSAELMDAVHDASDGLLKRAGEPLAQRALVAVLPADVRLVLCMWIQDLDLAVKLTAAMVRKAALPV